VRHPNLFEISAWPWLERLSARDGRRVTLGDVPARDWDALAGHGFTLLFLMGVWRRSVIGRELALADEALRREYDRALPGWTPDDVAGSPYCIQDYQPDERMGGWAGLDIARRELNRRGIGLVLDFVPNHTAFDHPWVKSHPDRFVRGTEDDLRSAPDEFRRENHAVIACGRDPYFAPWRDVAQLNYFNPDTRAAMIDVLRLIGAHADGVRCDMAMLVLNEIFDRTWRRLLRDSWPVPAQEFWPEATQALPDLLFLAEVYWDLEWRLQQQGFDFTYDKRLVDRLHAAPAADIRGHLAADPAFRDRLARFLENHDEPRSAATLGHRLVASATLLATLPGLRFYFDGQMEGRKIRTPVQLGRWLDEPVNDRIHEMYERLLRASAGRLFHDGDWSLLDVTPADDETFRDLIAYRWRLDHQLAIVAVNLGPRASHGHVQIAADLPPGDRFDFEDRLTDVVYAWHRPPLLERGLYVRLEPGEAHLLTVGAAAAD
jgi:hypothetical protein